MTNPISALHFKFLTSFYNVMKRYCIVMILPPEPLIDELSELMEKFNQCYNASSALNYKPHITLKSLGELDFYSFASASFDISKLAEETDPFVLHMEGLRFYGSREDIPGIYIPVQKTQELFDLHRKLATILKDYTDGKDRSFKELDNWKPHFTIVGPDISAKNLERAKKDLSGEKYSYEFPVNEITFYRYAEESLLPDLYGSLMLRSTPSIS